MHKLLPKGAFLLFMLKFSAKLILNCWKEEREFFLHKLLPKGALLLFDWETVDNEMEEEIRAVSQQSLHINICICVSLLICIVVVFI